METFDWLLNDLLAKLEDVAVVHQAKRRRHGAKHESTAKANNGTIVRFIERVDQQTLERLDRNREVLLAGKPSEATKLHRYAEHYLQNSTGSGIFVEYVQKSDGGRWSAQGVSLQKLTREVRGALAHSHFVDIDTINAHPTILLHVCRQNSWPCEQLARYVLNREAVFAEIDLPRAKSKEAINKMMYGGGLEEELAIDCRFLRQFQREMRAVSKLAFPTITDGRARRSSLAMMLQKFESQTLMAAVDFVNERGWQVGVLLHDGFMVYRRNDAIVDETLLAELSRRVEEKTTLQLSYQVKEFNQSLVLAERCE